jgi:hypothetical protein
MKSTLKVQGDKKYGGNVLEEITSRSSSETSCKTEKSMSFNNPKTMDSSQLMSPKFNTLAIASGEEPIEVLDPNYTGKNSLNDL